MTSYFIFSKHVKSLSLSGSVWDGANIHEALEKRSSMKSQLGSKEWTPLAWKEGGSQPSDMEGQLALAIREGRQIVEKAGDYVALVPAALMVAKTEDTPRFKPKAQLVAAWHTLHFMGTHESPVAQNLHYDIYYVAETRVIHTVDERGITSSNFYSDELAKKPNIMGLAARLVRGRFMVKPAEAKPLYKPDDGCDHFPKLKDAVFMGSFESPANNVVYDTYFQASTCELLVVSKGGFVSCNTYENARTISGIMDVARREAEKRFMGKAATITQAPTKAQIDAAEKKRAPLAWASEKKPFDPFKGWMDGAKYDGDGGDPMKKTRGAFGKSPDIEPANPLVGSASLMLGMGD